MHTLSVFPQILTFGLLAPFLLRVCVGIIIMLFGKEKQKSNHVSISIIYFLVGLFLIVGLYTQIASIIGILLLKWDFYWARKNSIPKDRVILYTVLIIILLSILFTGPGFLAFDLPL